MSQLRILDSHFHIWDPTKQVLPWLDGLDKLNHTFTLDQLEKEYADLGVDFLGGVYVEVDAADHELEDRLIGENPNPKILAKMLRVTLDPFMRVPIHATGIREPLHIPSEPRGRCLEPSFIGGLKAMAKKGMPFELCNRGEELGDMAKAFEQVPEVTVVLNHLGNVPGLDDDSCNALRAFAKLPHSYIKISGDNPVNPDIVKFVRDTFSPDRLLFSSNWPVVKLNSSLKQHLDLMVELFGDDEDFFMNNAKKAYGIKL